ncbi:EamA family transporter [Acinetobacter sp. ANC 5054]|uniref:DMT family transporter n=1 Tax=Acinetobacter sp. ANC 5054 TaxID=1977877 RepID=UPI000A34C3DB|nr:DMT family transporter [Acinetobacter sp. ANC 5054]OTG80117.1 EamA family transporter [Acinetobacter sp. ANC 5054]
MLLQARWAKFAICLPLIAVFIWSLNTTVTRYVVDYISPVSISFYRWLIAFVILTPFMLHTVWKQRALIMQHWQQLAVLSAFGMVLYQGLGYTAAHYTSATNMGIINAFIPVFTIAVSFFLLKDIPNRFALMGCGISFAGLLFVVAKGNFANLLSMGGHLGDLIMIFAVFFYAFYGVFLKKWQLTIPLLLSMYIQIFFALLYHLPFVLYFGLDPINMQNAASVFYAGIFPSLIAPMVWMLAVQHLGPNRTSIFMNLMPVCTALIAYYWLGEQWKSYHTVGTVLAILGVILAQRK